MGTWYDPLTCWTCSATFSGSAAGRSILFSTGTNAQLQIKCQVEVGHSLGLHSHSMRVCSPDRMSLG